jgi:hypothetical protein
MKIFRDESGQTVVVAAVFMALLGCGFMALALDVGNLYHFRRIAQVTANEAAMVAATEMGNGNTGLAQSAANAAAALNGVTTPVNLTISPTTGNYQGPYVIASVSFPVQTFFFGAVSHANSKVTVTATAIAGGGTGGVPGSGGVNLGSAGICSNGDINISNGAHINVNGLGIFDAGAGSNISITGGSTVSAGTVAGNGNITVDGGSTLSDTYTDAAGSISVTGGSSSSGAKKTIPATLTCDPVLPPAPPVSGCVADPGGNWTQNPLYFGPASPSGVACYNNLTIGANGMSDYLNPGVYVINGGTMHFVSGTTGHGCANSSGCSNLGGNGVFIYLANGANLLIDNGANVNLVAGNTKAADGSTTPDLGSYNGITVYEPTSNTNAMSFQGGSSTYMNGSILAPGAPVTLGNGSGSTTNGGVTAGTFTVNGGGTINITADDDGESGATSGTPATPVVFAVRPKMVQ